jgi:hypothetical protein
MRRRGFGASGPPIYFRNQSESYRSLPKTFWNFKNNAACIVLILLHLAVRLEQELG